MAATSQLAGAGDRADIRRRCCGSCPPRAQLAPEPNVRTIIGALNRVLCCIGLVLAAAALLPGPSLASAGQLSVIEDDAHLVADPAGTLAQFRLLGADVARVFVSWAQIAPRPNARTPPTGLDPSNPASYPAGSWSSFDAIDRAARREGVGLEFVLTGGAPRWAEGAGLPAAARGDPHRAWEPSARQFGAFVRAVGTRYSGAFADPQNPGQVLPRVSLWALWNEPNFGQDLAPQAVDGSRRLLAPQMYRALAGAAWSALRATGHGRDTLVIGELAAGGEQGPVTRAHRFGLPGHFAMTKPVRFLEALYCLDASYRRLTGAGARRLGCPAGASGTRRFRKQNPALFEASAFAIHPYSRSRPPDAPVSRDPDVAYFSDLQRLAHDLDRIQQAYHSGKRYALFDDEFGYITHPPNNGRYPSPRTAAYYLNWAEYLSWRNPRLASFGQYLLYDPAPPPGGGGFATGLETSAGVHKPTYDAYRLPLYLPRTVARRHSSLEVWGCIRPADYAALDTGAAQTVEIQLEPHSRGPFATIRTVAIADPRGYFVVRLRFPVSGTVRLAWAYPPSASTPGEAVFSRSVTITVR